MSGYIERQIKLCEARGSARALVSIVEQVCKNMNKSVEEVLPLMNKTIEEYNAAVELLTNSETA